MTFYPPNPKPYPSPYPNPNPYLNPYPNPLLRPGVSNTTASLGQNFRLHS